MQKSDWNDLTVTPWTAPEDDDLEPDVNDLARGGAGRVPVTQIMTRNVRTARADASLDTVGAVMLETGLSRMPVVDGSGQLVGMISKTDLLERQIDGDEEELESQGRLRTGAMNHPRGMHLQRSDALVSEWMTQNVVTVPETATIAETARLMASHHLHGVPVVSASGKLRGYVSSLDVLGWVARLE